MQPEKIFYGNPILRQKNNNFLIHALNILQHKSMFKETSVAMNFT